jgi:GT2 family glycosyltransferase
MDMRVNGNTGEVPPPVSRDDRRSLPELSIILVNWNSKEFVRQCLRSLWGHSQNTFFEVVVIDNGSFDGCDKMLADEFPAVVFIQNTENIGFARANNLAVRHSRGHFLLFLNPDTEFIQDSIRILCDRLDSFPNAGAVGCRLLNGDRTLQTSCVQSFPTVLNQMLDSEFLRHRCPRSSLWGMFALYSTDATAIEVEALSGACILVKRNVFDHVGGFTERYFMYGEDLDLCFRIKKEGYRNIYASDTSIVHYGGGSTSGQNGISFNVLMRQSVYQFLRFNRGRLSALCYRIAMATSSLVRILLIIILRAFSRSRVLPDSAASLAKWFSVLRWSLGLTSRANAGLPTMSRRFNTALIQH